jgi:uncharacterized protein DUF6252
MSTTRRIAPALAALALAAAGCGGGNGTGPNQNGTLPGDGGITASINGTAWRSSKIGDRVTHNGQIYVIGSINLPYTLTVSVFATRTGTFGMQDLNVATGGGSTATIVNAGSGWATGLPGGSGTLNITTLTANRIAGTFSFDAVPASGAASGKMQVRNGAFDLTY